MTERLLTAREVAELVRLSPESVLRRWRDGEIPGFPAKRGRVRTHEMPQNEERQLRTALGQVPRYRQLLEAEGRTVKAMWLEREPYRNPVRPVDEQRYPHQLYDRDNCDKRRGQQTARPGKMNVSLVTALIACLGFWLLVAIAVFTLT
jgi:hypothetical protein